MTSTHSHLTSVIWDYLIAQFPMHLFNAIVQWCSSNIAFSMKIAFCGERRDQEPNILLRCVGECPGTHHHHPNKFKQNQIVCMESSITENNVTTFLDHFLTTFTSSQESVTTAPLDSLHRAKDFLTKTLSLLNSKITEENKKPIQLDETNDWGAILLQVDDLQLIEPRGRFKTKFYGDRLTLEGKQGSAIILGDNLAYMALLPSITSSKKEGEDVFVVVLKEGVMFGGKELQRLVVNLSRTTQRTMVDKQGVEEVGIESNIVSHAFRSLGQVVIDRPNPRLFCSMLQQKPFVRCHRGTQEGAIYPMLGGIIFLKPLVFLPVDSIASITAGRGGGSGNTRYVDLKVEMADDKVHEFVNIDREELPSLQGYVKAYLEVRNRNKAAATANSSTDRLGDEDEDDDDEDDEDYDPGKPESESESSDDEDEEGEPAQERSGSSMAPVVVLDGESAGAEGDDSSVEEVVIKKPAAAVKKGDKPQAKKRSVKDVITKSEPQVEVKKAKIDFFMRAVKAEPKEVIDLMSPKEEKPK